MNKESKYFESSTDTTSDLLKHPWIKVVIGIGGTLILILIAGEVMKILANTITSFKELKNAINS